MVRLAILAVGTAAVGAEVQEDMGHNHILGNLVVVDHILGNLVVVDHIVCNLVVEYNEDCKELHVPSSLFGLQVHSLDLLAGHILGLHGLHSG